MSALVLTKENFQKEVMESDKPVLVDFWAPWCGPCRMVSPLVDEIANEIDYAKVGKVNVDEQSELAAQYGVMSIPTLIVLKTDASRSKPSAPATKTAYAPCFPKAGTGSVKP